MSERSSRIIRTFAHRNALRLYLRIQIDRIRADVWIGLPHEHQHDHRR
jgi:hypothetical protein